MQTPLETNVPAETYEEALTRACEVWGVQREFWDIFGARHVATPEVRKAVLSSLGVPAESRELLNEALEQRARAEWSNLMDSTVVESLSTGSVPVQFPLDAPGRVRAHFRWEDGTASDSEFAVSDLEVESEGTAGGRSYLRMRLPPPTDAPLGYHEVELSDDLGRRSTARLILTPDRAYQPAFLDNGRKAAGVAVSLYGIRSGRNWGCGDFTDLRGFADWMTDEVEASFIALNPLHSIPNRQPYNTSPYLPNCSFYRNPLYLDVEAIEDVRESPWAQRLLGTQGIQAKLAELRSAKYVEYEKVFALKLPFLKLGFRRFLHEYRNKTARGREFQRYIDREGELLDRYAVYSALDEVLHKRDRNLWIWPDWPREFQDPSSPAVAQFVQDHSRTVLFYKYVQWQVDQQLAAAQAHSLERGLSIGLYHDLALATDRCGSDLWAHRPFYIEGCRVGSPPDGFAPDGQDWAFPPPNSLRHRQNGYRLFAESIRKNCTHGGALRIDHVMRFFRLFWIPEGSSAKRGVYVRDFSEDLLRILALESVRNRVIVIGEDLGTVEPYIREALHRYGVLSYRLLYFEKHEDGTFKLPSEYPRQSLASVSTHDLPTLEGFWTGRDIEARRAAGVIGTEANYRQQLREREQEKQQMLDTMLALKLLPDWFPKRASEVPEFTGELHNAAVGFLASTPSMLMVLNQEDLFKDPDQQNLPGTTEQYPNWRHKMKYTLEQLSTNRQARDCTKMFRDWLTRTGRLNA